MVLLSCKAFDLDDAIASFAPAVGPQTAILPLLNGMLHLDALDAKFGRERVLGGLCAIAATLDEQARGGATRRRCIRSLSASATARCRTESAPSPRRCPAPVSRSSASDAIMQEMWEKWVFLATLAAVDLR